MKSVIEIDEIEICKNEKGDAFTELVNKTLNITETESFLNIEDEIVIQIDPDKIKNLDQYK